MSWLCRLIGHKFVKYSEGQEKPYQGMHRHKGRIPHTLLLTMVHCQRCCQLETLSNYFFSEQEDEDGICNK